jgi:hypothetical protein
LRSMVWRRSWAAGLEWSAARWPYDFRCEDILEVNKFKSMIISHVTSARRFVQIRTAKSYLVLMSTESASTRTREPDDSQDARSPKRTKIDQSLTDSISPAEDAELGDILPPSHVLLGIARPTLTADGSIHRIVEADVGISEYISHDVSKISGIIKQRCADCFGSNIDTHWP